MIPHQNDETESKDPVPVLAALPSAHTPIELIELAGHSPDTLGGLTRAYSMVTRAERLYEQDPTDQNEDLLKTARRLLHSLQTEVAKG